MPGKSYNNPQLEYEKNKQAVATETRRQETARQAAQQKAINDKKAAALKDQIASNQKTINKLAEVIKSAEKTKAGYITSYNQAYRDSINPSGPGGATQTPGELAAIASWQNLITGREQLITSTTNGIKDLKNKNDALTKQLNQLTSVKTEQTYSATKGRVTTTTTTTSVPPKPGTGSGSSSGSTEPNKLEPSKSWRYNLPLIKPARFSTSATAPLNSSLRNTSNLVGIPGDVDASNYWGGIDGPSNATPGRGVLRVNKQWMKEILTATDEDLLGKTPTDSTADKSLSSFKPDTQMYGFRFLYNPEKISMAYEINDKLNPAMIATGRDKFMPVTTVGTTISVDIVLNRVEDMKYRKDPERAIRNQVYFSKGETATKLAEVKELHQKGTMYDMEYLFKTMNAPLGSFWSKYNGTTADMGFIRPVMLELHLGNRMRYPVRILGMAVEHKIFDPRMVPIFSVVRMTFARIIEFSGSRSGKSSFSSGGDRRAI